MLFGRKISNTARYWLSALSVPFFIILAFYAFILGVALTFAVVLLWQIQKWRIRKREPQRHQPVEIIYNKRSDWESK